MCNNHWKDILKEDSVNKIMPQRPDAGPGTRGVAKRPSQWANTRDGVEDPIEWDDLTTAQKTRFRKGIICHHCDALAEWKCTNSTCFYDGTGNPQGIQVCGLKGKDHHAYEMRINSSHNFVPIEQFGEPDPEKGYYI